MEVIGLRLNEVVNKACAGVDYKTKKGFKKGQGWTVGESVVKELPYPPNDAYLIRAVLRTAVRSLSIYTTRLESLLLPALSDTTFSQALSLTGAAGPAVQPLNPAQYYAVTVAHAAWETCEVLEQALETRQWPRFVNETLRPVMDKLDLVVGKVIQPLLQGLKRDLVASLARTDGTSPPGGKVVGLASIPAPAAAGPVLMTKEPSQTPGSRLVKEPSDRGHARSLAIPVCLQHFAARVDGARKVLEIIAAPCADDGEGWVTGVAVATAWKGMCVLSDRDWSQSNGRPPSPGSVARALHGLANKEGQAHGHGHGHAPASTIPSAPLSVTAKLTNGLGILPSRSASRPASPPRSKLDPSVHALLSFEGLLKRLVQGLVQPPSATASDPNATEHLAREALHEALEAVESFRIVSTAMASGPHASSRIMNSLVRVRDDVDDETEEALDDAIEDLPPVTLFAILHKQANAVLAYLPAVSAVSDDEKATGAVAPQLQLKTPSEVWGWTKADFERQVLSGFGAAEEHARRVALALKGEVERVLSELARLAARISEEQGAAKESDGRESKAMRDVKEAVVWVKALGVATEARTGVRPVGA